MASTAGTRYSLIPKQKYKRGKRCSRLRCSSLDTDSQPLSPLGYFQTLPLEIFQMILVYLSVKDISMLSMVSKAVSHHLINYISTPSGNRRLIWQDFHNPEPPGRREGSLILEHYKSLGLMLKRCTLLLPTKDRLKFIHRVISEVSCFKLSGCPNPLQCLGLQCYGVFLQILTSGWDELECHRVFNFLCELNNLPREVQTVVSSRPGSAWKLELRIRLYCRRVLLNHWIYRRDCAFWLTRILKPWPMVNQARLLYVIFGPVSSLDGHVAWHKMVEGPSDETSLKGLAEAIKLLYDREAREWTTDDVISLVDELSVVPQKWMMENNARLLHLSGKNICFTFMSSKAVNGRTAELAKLTVFLALVCEKDVHCMDWAVKMMQKVCKAFITLREKKNFLQSVENAFAHVMMDMLQRVLSGDRDEENGSFFELFHFINAQTNFHKKIMFLSITRSNSSSHYML
ncbi:F-box only protein 47 [Colius striatus]|uniref:F-box only protein 47 n=1 Tax=Colius striatus TaxID=57412 RepID=UPI002B1DCA8A|nr:F-box only protein 47 [Colius striatus]